MIDAAPTPAQRPSVGRIVLYRHPTVTAVEPEKVVPAVVTRVWSDTCVNLRILDDAPGNPEWQTSVVQGPLDGEGHGRCWNWPPRI